MARIVNPAPDLGPRPSDARVPEDLFPKLSPFCNLKPPPNLDKFPGSVVLRSFKKGEVICRQGDAGWTAFYFPTTRELFDYRQYPQQQIERETAEKAKVESEIAQLEAQLATPGLEAKKADAARKKLDEQRARADALSRSMEALKGYAPLLKKEVKIDLERLARIAVAAAAEKQLEQRRKTAETARAEADESRYHGLLIAETAAKRGTAEEVQNGDPDLAEWLRASADGDEARRLAAVKIYGPVGRPAPSGGFWSKLTGRLFARPRSTRPSRKAFIPIDGPRDLAYGTRETYLEEGELFGEMSCLYRTPRAATVVATRDCYAIEMLRNVLDMMLKDAGYRERMDQIYRDRVLELQLRDIPLLSHLDDRLIERLRLNAELVEYQAGSLIYDQQDRSDDMHLIRSGIVKVMKNVSFLIRPKDVDPAVFLADYRNANEPEAADLIWQKLPADLRAELEGVSTADAATALRPRLADALNGVLKDAHLGQPEPMRRIEGRLQLGREVWLRLADPRKGSEREWIRCQRLLFESVFGGKIPARPLREGGDTPYFVTEPNRDVKDWASLFGEDAKPGDPKRRVWDLLAEPARVAQRKAKKGTALDAQEQSTVMAALNDVLRGRPLVLYDEFHTLVRTKEKPARIVMEFLPGQEIWSEHDFVRLNRALNRFLLQAVFPKAIVDARRREGPVRVVAYSSRGEMIGEAALFENRRHSATCVAYNHPEDDPQREVGPVQLVRINRALFEELKRESEPFRKAVQRAIDARRIANATQLAASMADEAAAPMQSARAEELGLIQGQRLMLIDLDRCTRCDECVRACVNTHDDGRSRLFLDGPRFGKYLVPATCRSCLDPVCMIGCPVGSIHRGDNGEILIEDWCIGCEKCADQCPYGSIQMHDIGVVPETCPGWRYTTAAAAGPSWTRRSYGDSGWLYGSAPFHFDREFRANLASLPGANGDTTRALCFRYPFVIASSGFDPGDRFLLALSTIDERAAVWLNGTPVITPPASAAAGDGAPARHGAGKAGADSADAVKRKKTRDGWWDLETEVAAKLLRAGSNVVAVQVTPCACPADLLLRLRIDEIKTPRGSDVIDDITEKLVTNQAVVCDLCSNQFGQVPACVTACPHDAAIRIDARGGLPVG